MYFYILGEEGIPLSISHCCGLLLWMKAFGLVPQPPHYLLTHRPLASPAILFVCAQSGLVIVLRFNVCWPVTCPSFDTPLLCWEPRCHTVGGAFLLAGLFFGVCLQSYCLWLYPMGPMSIFRVGDCVSLIDCIFNALCVTFCVGLGLWPIPRALFWATSLFEGRGLIFHALL